MNEDIEIKKSEIHGKGVFAVRDFEKGEIVLKWNSKPIEKANVEKLLENEKMYLIKINGEDFLMQPPERYINHSCDPNTLSENNCDVAVRDIKKGEEITSKYDHSDVNFKCTCQNCKK